MLSDCHIQNGDCGQTVAVKHHNLEQLKMTAIRQLSNSITYCLTAVIFNGSWILVFDSCMTSNMYFFYSERDSYSSDESVSTFLASHKLSSSKSSKGLYQNDTDRR